MFCAVEQLKVLDVEMNLLLVETAAYRVVDRNYRVTSGGFHYVSIFYIYLYLVILSLIVISCQLSYRISVTPVLLLRFSCQLFLDSHVQMVLSTLKQMNQSCMA